MSSSNQRSANRGCRSVLRCALSHYRQFPWLSAPESVLAKLVAAAATRKLLSTVRTAATGVVVLFALWHEDQVKTGFQFPSVRLFLSYRRSRRK